MTPLWGLREEASSWMDRTASLAAKDVEEMQPDRLNTLKEEDEDAEGESRSRSRRV